MRAKLRGFSMIEVILAIALVGAVLFAVLDYFPQALVASRAREDRLQALQVALSTLQDQKHTALSLLASEPAQQDLLPATINGIPFARHLEVLPIPGADPQHLLALRVTVTWSGVNHQPMMVVQESQVFQNE